MNFTFSNEEEGSLARAPVTRLSTITILFSSRSASFDASALAIKPAPPVTSIFGIRKVPLNIFRSRFCTTVQQVHAIDHGQCTPCDTPLPLYNRCAIPVSPLSPARIDPPASMNRKCPYRSEERRVGK